MDISTVALFYTLQEKLLRKSCPLRNHENCREEQRRSMGIGVLIVFVETVWTQKDLGRPKVLPFKIMGYQIPDEFYVPKYEIDSVRRDNRYDERSTIYWQPVVKICKDAPAKLSFYTADAYGKYSVIVEGITSRGVICRKRVPLILK